MPNQTGGDAFSGLPHDEKVLLAGRHPAATANARTFGSPLEIGPDEGGGHLQDSRYLSELGASPDTVVAGLCMVKK